MLGRAAGIAVAPNFNEPTWMVSYQANEQGEKLERLRTQLCASRIEQGELSYIDGWQLRPWLHPEG